MEMARVAIVCHSYNNFFVLGSSPWGRDRSVGAEGVRRVWEDRRAAQQCGNSRCPAGKMYDLLKNHFTDLPVLFSEICKSAEVLEGDGKSLGSVRRWTYLMHDTSDELLEVIEKVVDVDDENRSLTLSAIGGDVLRTHKRFDVKVIVTPKGTGSSVKWHIIFEKVNEDDPHPDPYLELFNTTHERLELHYHKDE
ncbi:hypothetical protein Scep_022920 [Stephania cephalantha]|uniref:Bet v I/Major latex protein domain-containing protein n=1 Tax=Stephania cephalantha TaxID=152367 RepID=A0AAP0F7C2_9MAGN